MGSSTIKRTTEKLSIVIRAIKSYSGSFQPSTQQRWVECFMHAERELTQLGSCQISIFTWFRTRPTSKAQKEAADKSNSWIGSYKFVPLSMSSFLIIHANCPTGTHQVVWLIFHLVLSRYKEQGYKQPLKSFLDSRCHQQRIYEGGNCSNQA